MAFQGASSSSTGGTNEVFLSFRGKDTRTNFTAHLCEALRQKGINTFKDDERLKSGEKISPALLKAIKESQISIIVFSKNYASSKWCLDELINILERKKTKGQQVLPVFYKVDPSEVRNQTNSFEEAFIKHKKMFKDDQTKVQRWKTALTEAANLSGKHSESYRNEPEFIHDIIEWVNSILVKKVFFQVAQYPIGIKSRVQAVESRLDIEKNDITCMVGIFGTGGIGKTTIAKAIYNSIASQFEGGSCFLEDIREKSNQEDGLVHLQNKLLSNILGESSSMVDNVDQGITLIKQRLCSLKIFLVLDDVDQSIQLEKLVGKGDLFGLGSRIIITTRDKHLLTVHGVDSTYQVNKLDDNEDLALFSWHAFNKDKPDDDYVEVTKDAVRYAGGLPLALIVVGSALKGENVEYVKKILVGCGFSSYSGIEELKDKCLISESHGSLVMHDLIQEMGREIVRQESPNEHGKRSRLWLHEDVLDVLEENTGTNNVEGILIDSPESDLIDLSSKAFMEMKMLRLFICCNARFSQEINFLPNELRLLYWPEYPGESLPSNFRGRKLAVLRMPHSHLIGLEGVEIFQNLTIMNFTYCEFLKKIPDVSKISNLTTLILDGCAHLVEVHSSVGSLNKLVDLSLENCYRLRSFLRSLKLRNLESLVLCGCLELKNFPEIECQMKYLEYVDYQYTGIEKLPSSIGHLIGVKKLYLTGCKNLKNLPDSIYQLQHLERLILKDCTGVKRLPSSIRYLVKVKTLDLSGCTNLMNLPNSIYHLQDLEELDLKGCSKLVKFPNNRQTMPSIASKDESEISHGEELVQLFRNSNDGCSSTTFPKLLRE
ncbi:disease resistance protein RPV1-like [Corylus avellana]|uniref:disease resistance protein RPV1-like n=1 Tax=Corylus avellana TaxID=13451 RepID=UPI00286BA9D3|nr:disease resistance protein RPV1-like [Corylus avellana]